MEQHPSDLVDLNEATKMFKRSKQTFREWKRAGKVQAYRGANGKLLFSIAEINKHMAIRSTFASRAEQNPAKITDKEPSGVSGWHPTDILSVYPETDTQQTTLGKLYERYLTNLENQVKEAKEQKESMRRELDLKIEELHQAHLRIMSLERQIAGEPQALLEEDVPAPEQEDEARQSRSWSPLKVRDRAFSVYDHLNKWTGRTGEG